jgi:hypothetical protein
MRYKIITRSRNPTFKLQIGTGRLGLIVAQVTDFGLNDVVMLLENWKIVSFNLFTFI